MTFADFLSILSVLVLPAAVSYRIFRSDHGRPRPATWTLAAIGGPFVYGLLALLVFAIWRLNIGGFAEGFLALLVGLVSASVCAVFVRPKARSRSPVRERSAG